MKISEKNIKDIRDGDRVLSLAGVEGKVKSKEANRGHYRGVYDDEIVIVWSTGLTSTCPHSMLNQVEYLGKPDA